MARMAAVTAEVIIALVDYPEGRTLSDLAADLGRSPSSVQRALSTLTGQGVVRRAEGLHPRFRLRDKAPVTALVEVARWSLPQERLDGFRKATRGHAARQAAARSLGAALPGTAASVWVPAAVERVVDRFDPKRIVLFGSQASGKARWDSDFDFLVVLSGVGDRRDAAVEIRRALSDLPIAKDVLVVTEREFDARSAGAGTAVREAKTNGLTVYERA